MTPLSPSNAIQPRKRRRWGRVVLVIFLAGIGIFCWRDFTWRRAIRQLREAGFYIAAQDARIGERWWKAVRNDWHQLFQTGTWREQRTWYTIDPTKAGKLRNLNALAPALRRVSPYSLNLSGCTALQNVDGLKGLTALGKLNLSACPALQNVNGLKGLTALWHLDLSDCSALQNVDGLNGLASLQHLNLRDCPAVQNVDAIKGLTALQGLILDGCPTLQNVEILKRLTVLDFLRLSDCPMLRDVDDLKGLTLLKVVDLRGCPKLPPEKVAALEAALPSADIVGP